jgi:hypothetical protein
MRNQLVLDEAVPELLTLVCQRGVSPRETQAKRESRICTENGAAVRYLLKGASDAHRIVGIGTRMNTVDSTGAPCPLGESNCDLS